MNLKIQAVKFSDQNRMFI